MSKVTTDPIADMLTRIRNALAVNQSLIVLPHSKVKQSVAEILSSSGYISSVSSDGEGTAKSLKLVLIDEGSSPKITQIRRLSKPGMRTYVSGKEIPRIKSGRGIVIISTSQGIMSGDEARKANIGGELICEVY